VSLKRRTSTATHWHTVIALREGASLCWRALAVGRWLHQCHKKEAQQINGRWILLINLLRQAVLSKSLSSERIPVDLFLCNNLRSTATLNNPNVVSWTTPIVHVRRPTFPSAPWISSSPCSATPPSLTNVPFLQFPCVCSNLGYETWSADPCC
ncbi:hypothetical protein EJ110_NYTH38574, partial [Nymphaea thermarum]